MKETTLTFKKRVYRKTKRDLVKHVDERLRMLPSKGKYKVFLDDNTRSLVAKNCIMSYYGDVDVLILYIFHKGKRTTHSGYKGDALRIDFPCEILKSVNGVGIDKFIDATRKKKSGAKHIVRIYHGESRYYSQRFMVNRIEQTKEAIILSEIKDMNFPASWKLVIPQKGMRVKVS